MKNLAHEWIRECGMTLEQARESWDGACVEFVGDFLDAISRGRLAYFEDPPKIYKWRHHAVAEIDGTVHDLWRDGPGISLADFCEEMGCEPEYPAEEEEPLTALP